MSVSWFPPSHCSGTFAWVDCSNGSTGPHPVRAGVDKDGGPIYVGRAFHEGDILPAKVTPSHGCAYVSYGGEEISKSDYEVLSSAHTAWKSASGGSVPSEAIQIGATSDGEPLYTGRVLIDGTLTPGKVHPSHGVLYVPYDGQENKFEEYEVLCLL